VISQSQQFEKQGDKALTHFQCAQQSSPHLLTPSQQTWVRQHASVRMDQGVTRKVNHLLKIPFSVHPATGAVCVPILWDNLALFEPESCVHVESFDADRFSLIVKEFEDWVGSS
jgi:DNA primase small subunit